jgi:hypothetical protein
MRMKKAKSGKTSGTSFFGDTVFAQRRQLVEVLGEPVIDGDVGKVQYAWEMENSDGTCFTVYDYYFPYTIHEDTQVNWHIGAHNADTAKKSAQQLQQLISSIPV